MRIAVIGSGISGLGAAWLLRDLHEVHVFESRDRLGGHTHTVHVDVDDAGRPSDRPTRTLPVDTGFIVYNEPTYPNLIRMFAELGVETQASDMSFAVRIEEMVDARGRTRDYEYAGSGKGLIAQRENLTDVGHYRLVRDIVRFFRLGNKMVDDPAIQGMTLGGFLIENKLSDEFADRYLRPMTAAIWSTGTGPVDEFPIATLLTFFRNHGLLGVTTHHPWRTVTGGTSSYIPLLTAHLPADRIHLGRGAQTVTRHGDGITLVDTLGDTHEFDAIIISAHADAALGMLADASPREKELLGVWEYANNDTWLHTDVNLLPRRMDARASWNYMFSKVGESSDSVSLSYWMNKLQDLDTDIDYVVTLNPTREPAPETVIRRMNYRHPVFTPASVATQDHLDELNGTNNTYFCGAYQRYGFHEDGFWSAVRVARHLGSTW